MHSIPLAEDDVTPALADPALDLSADLRGTLVAGRHELAELFFHGDQGSVYLGRDTHSNRPVEVKILASEAATTAAVDRFRERSRRMLGLSHPGIAAVLSEGITENGLPFVVMEHREGRNLLHLLGDPRVAWPAPEAVVRQLAEALAALHALGVVHGSVSAGNIVWIEDGGASPRVQLVDREFHLPDADEFASFSKPGDSGREATRETTPADDLHALGQVVYELCTGTPPTPGSVHSMRQPDAQVAVPASFESVVLALLDPDPAGRPASAIGLLDLLDRASGMQPGDLDFLAALGEPEPTRFGTPSSAPASERSERFATIPPQPAERFATLPPSASRFVVTEAPPPSPMDTSSSAAHALAAAMDAFDSDEPPERQRVPIPEPKPPAEPAIADIAAEVAPAEVPTFAAPDPTANASASADPDELAASASASQPDLTHLATAASDASASDPRLHAATPSDPPALIEPTTATARSEPTTSPAQPSRRLALPEDRTRLLLIVLAVGVLLILLAWQLRGEPTPEPTPTPTPTPAPVAAPPHAERRVPDPPEPEVTLASGAAPALPSAPEPAPAAVPDAPPDAGPDAAPDAAPAEPTTAEPAIEQLSAGEFRRLMLRSNRSEAVRNCYRKHARPGEEDIAVIALVTPAGRIQKPRLSPEIPLGDCLRKIIVKLEFPTATRPAQHNFVYRHPDAL